PTTAKREVPAPAAASAAPVVKGGKKPALTTAMTPSRAIEWLQADYEDFTTLDLSNSHTITSEQGIAIAKALETNTHLLEVHLCGDRLPNSVAKAMAAMLRRNSTLRVLDLEVRSALHDVVSNTNVRARLCVSCVVLLLCVGQQARLGRNRGDRVCAALT